ncbi:MAG: hypothetical protein EOO52_13645 [Gammaproteobacteria bacterium]|nr:MAG: hypothetical protein EOO52_13645 [Gammaproteobacteria bacterium]
MSELLASIPEIRALKDNIDIELASNPELRPAFMTILERLRVVKDAMTASAREVSSDACCVDISFEIDQSGYFTYVCDTYGIYGEDDVYEHVLADLKIKGITMFRFRDREFPF